MPGGLSAWAARIYGVLPEGAVSRLLPRSLRYEPAAVPVAHAEGTAPVRLLVAPVNFAGQGEAWARAVERASPDVTAVSMAYHQPGAGFGFPVGVEVPASAYTLSRAWHRRQQAAIESDFTHVLVETGRPPAGAPYRESVARQLTALRRAGVALGYLAHGTDVRVPSIHAADNPDSPFRTGDHSALEHQARSNLDLIARLGLPSFVSTPDLLDFLPDATWLPVVVTPSSWATNAPVLMRDRPVVVHAPSSGPMKGSDVVDPVMTTLHERGIIEYRRLTGIPARQMPEVYRHADIVLEQFRIGGYGVAACEAMAAGRIVVGHVTPRVRDHVAAAAGMPLPIVQSSASELREVVLRILAERERFAEAATDGPAFVERLHDGAASAEALRRFLGA